MNKETNIYHNRKDCPEADNTVRVDIEEALELNATPCKHCCQSDAFIFEHVQNAGYHLDKAVMEAYGFSKDISEADIVAELMKRYLQITQKR